MTSIQYRLAETAAEVEETLAVLLPSSTSGWTVMLLTKKYLKILDKGYPMKLFFFYSIVLFSGLNAHGAFQEVNGLRSAPKSSVIDSGGIDFSYSFNDWTSVWKKKPGISLLHPAPGDGDIAESIGKDGKYTPAEEVGVFHGRVFFVVKRPVAELADKNYQAVDFFKSMDTSSRISSFTQGCPSFCLQTQSPFPEGWQELIESLKGNPPLDFLDKSTVGYIETKSEITVFEREAMDPTMKKTLFALHKNIPQKFIFGVHQNGYEINQMARFMSTLVSFYDYGGGATLVAVDLSFALETDLDDKMNKFPGARGLIGLIFGLSLIHI